MADRPTSLMPVVVGVEAARVGVMPSFSKVSHISFSVRDAAASAIWWKQVFDFQDLDRAEGPGWRGILMIHPRSTTILEVQQHEANAGETFDPIRTGFDHLGFKVDDRSELQAWQAHLAGLGVDHTPIVDRGYGSVLTFRDPDGIQFEMFFRGGHRDGLA
jgi:glyoxylase I family protein